MKKISILICAGILACTMTACGGNTKEVQQQAPDMQTSDSVSDKVQDTAVDTETETDADTSADTAGDANETETEADAGIDENAEQGITYPNAVQ